MVIDASKLMIKQPEGSNVYFRKLSVDIQFRVMGAIGPLAEQDMWDMAVDTYWISGRYAGKPVHPD